jgi:hypothetical protein
VHVSQQHERRVVVDRRDDLIRGHEFQPARRAGADRALDHVQVRRKVTGLRQHDAAVGADRERRADQLVEVDRGAVADDHLVGARSDQLRKFRADALGSVDPVVVVPAADQALAPFDPCHAVEALAGIHRKCAE